MSRSLLRCHGRICLAIPIYYLNDHLSGDMSPMRIAFLDFGNTEYDPTTVDTRPLGGTESATCYLSRSLARQGHEVYLLGKVPFVGTRGGVMCMAREQAPHPSSLGLDAMICSGFPSDPR